MRFFAWLALGSVIAFPRCFSEDKIVKPVEYKNSGEKIQFNEPLSIFSGGWDTQTFEAYVLYLIATEKLGLNATFYPPMNEDDMKTLSFGFHWLGEVYDDWAYTDYWNSYPNRMAEGKVHIIADVLPTHLEYEPFRNNCTVQKTNILIDIGLHIATHMTMDNGNMFYQSLKENDTLLELCKNATCVKVNGSENCKGQIYASSAGYATTRQVVRNLEAHDLESRWEMNVLGSDEALYEKIQEHKETGEHGLYASWSPSTYNGVTPAVPIVWEYNPTGNSDDPKVLDGTSSLPPYQSAICISNHLDEIRSEITHEMTYDMNLNRLELSEMLTRYASNGRDIHAAVCEWMKENEDIVDSWVVNANQLEFIEDFEGLNMELIMILVFVALILAGGVVYAAHYCGLLRCLSDVVIGPVTSGIFLFAWKLFDVAGSLIMFTEINGADDVDPMFVIVFSIFGTLHAITFFMNLYYTLFYMSFLLGGGLNSEGGEHIMETFNTGPTTPENWQFNYDINEHHWKMAFAGTLSLIFEDIFGTILGAYACVMYKNMINEMFILGFIIQCIETGISATEPYALIQYSNRIKTLEEHQNTFRVSEHKDITNADHK